MGSLQAIYSEVLTLMTHIIETMVATGFNLGVDNM